MPDVPLAVGFTAGMLAAFNPCGFAMLPAYLSFFLGTAGSGGPAAVGLVPALRVGAVVTAGFVAVFGLAGVAITGLSLSVERYAPWATVLIGVALVPLGVAVAAGASPTLVLPRLQRGGSGPALAPWRFSASRTPLCPSPAPSPCSWPRCRSPSSVTAWPRASPFSSPTPPVWESSSSPSRWRWPSPASPLCAGSAVWSPSPSGVWGPAGRRRYLRRMVRLGGTSAGGRRRSCGRARRRRQPPLELDLGLDQRRRRASPRRGPCDHPCRRHRRRAPAPDPATRHRTREMLATTGSRRG